MLDELGCHSAALLTWTTAKGRPRRRRRTTTARWYTRPGLARFPRLTRRASPLSEKLALKERRKKAKQQALESMPYTFGAPPTTQEALEELVAAHCKTGKDVMTLLERVHK